MSPKQSTKSKEAMKESTLEQAISKAVGRTAASRGGEESAAAKPVRGKTEKRRSVSEKKESKTYLTKEELKRAAKLFGLYAAFLLLIWGLGFLITAPVLLFAISVLFSYESRPDDPLAKRLVRSAIYAVIVGGALYLLYVTVLQTQLPTGALWKLFKT